MVEVRLGETLVATFLPSFQIGKGKFGPKKRVAEITENPQY
jgi:hypothetical protein